MLDVVMKSYIVRSIQYDNKINGAETLEIGADVESLINYNDETSECICTFTLLAGDIGGQQLFKVSITIEAIYGFSPADNKKSIHVKINEELFAQTRAMVCAMCGVSGVPAIVIPTVAFSEENTVERT